MIYLLEAARKTLADDSRAVSKRDGSKGTLCLVTSNTTLDGGQIMGLYQGNNFEERRQVEEYHKSLKQNASLSCSPTRTKRT